MKVHLNGADTGILLRLVKHFSPRVSFGGRPLGLFDIVESKRRSAEAVRSGSTISLEPVLPSLYFRLRDPPPVVADVPLTGVDILNVVDFDVQWFTKLHMCFVFVNLTMTWSGLRRMRYVDY